MPGSITAVQLCAVGLTTPDLQADEYTFTTLIKTLSYSGQVDAALQVQDAMRALDFDPTDTVWGSLIAACGQAGGSFVHAQVNDLEIVMTETKHVKHGE